MAPVDGCLIITDQSMLDSFFDGDRGRVWEQSCKSYTHIMAAHLKGGYLKYIGYDWFFFGGGCGGRGGVIL